MPRLHAALRRAKREWSFWRARHASGPLGNADSGAQRTGRRVLVCDYRVPRPAESAGDLLIHGITVDLGRLGYEVTFLPLDLDTPGPSSRLLAEAGVEVVSGAVHRRPADFLARQAASFDLIYVFRFEVGEQIIDMVRALAPDATLILHDPDLAYVRVEREAALLGRDYDGPAPADIRRRELAVLRRADHVVVVSEAEANMLAVDAPDIDCMVLPSLCVPVQRRARPAHAREPRVTFVGGFRHRPNSDAVLWFAEAVWPLVRAQLPTAEFAIAGPDAPRSVRALDGQDGIRVLGPVAQLDALLRDSRVSVAPLRFGAGIKGKLAYAMAAGTPVVTTTIGAEGMDLRHGETAMIADDPTTFAAAIVHLFTDDDAFERMAEAGRLHAGARFGEDAARASLLAVLHRAKALPLPLFAAHCRAIPAMHPAVLPDAVDVSIIIPAFNRWTLTRACIASILETTPQHPYRYEIIVGDDGSSDDTSAADMLFSGVRVHRSAQNGGFLANANATASAARGRLLIFLNNDTLVLPGWLQRLAETLDSDPEIGIAGGKIIFPDGRVQEAGAVLYSDGSAAHIGRDGAAEAGLVMAMRDVDFVSGSLLCIRRDDWLALGGFDQAFSPAYCEDVDLALRMRQRGRRIVCVPEAMVVHIEHGSYGVDALGGTVSAQDTNIATLRRKWSEVLGRDHAAPGDMIGAIAAAARRGQAAPIADGDRPLRTLFFSPFPTHPARHGNRAAMTWLGNGLLHAGPVHFVCLDTPDLTMEGRAQMQRHWTTLDVLPFANPMTPAAPAIGYDGWYEKGLGERIAELCQLYQIDIVVCSYVFQSALLDHVPSGVLKVIDTHDRMADRYALLKENGIPVEFFSCSTSDERRYLQRADVVLALEDVEATHFRTLVGDAVHVLTAPRVPPARRTWQLRQSSGRPLIAGMVASANQTNLHMVADLLRTCAARWGGDWPIRIEVAGDVRLLVETLDAVDRRLFSLPQVQLHGYVPDIESFYGALDVAVAPVTAGTGVNIKSIEALRFGAPLLATRAGSKGLPVTAPLHQLADVESLVTVLSQLAGDDAMRGALAADGHAVYEALLAQSNRALESLVALARQRLGSDGT